MLISASTNIAVRRLGFEAGVTMLRDVGFDCLDLALFEMVEDDSVYLSSERYAVAEARARFARENGIAFNQMHAPFAFKWAEDDIRESIAKPRVEEALRIGAMIGAKIAIVHPIHYMEYKGNEEYSRSLNLEYYSSLIPLAKECGIKIAIENMWQRDPRRKYIVDDVAAKAEEHAWYIDQLNSEWITACLDVGHTALVGEDVADTIRVLGNRLGALHIHDNNYLADQHLIPFLGGLDWQSIMSALREVGYAGEFTLETDAFLKKFPVEMLRDAAAFMHCTARFLVENY